MTAPVSTIPTVRLWLLAQFQAVISAAGYTAPGVEVYLSEVDHNSANDLVIIGGAKRQVESFAFVGGGGSRAFKEVYTIQVDIECWGSGPESFPAVDARAFAVLGLLEQTVRADLTAGGSVIVIKPHESESTHEWAPDDQGNAGARVTITTHFYVSAEL